MELSYVAVEVDLLFLLVDSITESEQSVIDKGFIQIGTEDINATTRRINLTATALTKYNNTEIQCAAIEIGKAKQKLSNNGTLKVQGTL